MANPSTSEHPLQTASSECYSSCSSEAFPVICTNIPTPCVGVSILSTLFQTYLLSTMSSLAHFSSVYVPTLKLKATYDDGGNVTEQMCCVRSLSNPDTSLALSDQARWTNLSVAPRKRNVERGTWAGCYCCSPCWLDGACSQ